ncbi:hypothetical protein D9615_008256 [Tricholomella constricta]|uniref:Hydrophobin n=1 Tax=Tricholomella constricta TaxID=117010 RepID=A0A8H5H359_9AGAR|nr:hypothetical protein D9615_008256 [Tricholomella constricta]
MFARTSSVFLFVLLALPFLAAASVVPRNIPASQCNTGDLQCCQSVQAASSDPVSLLLGLLGVVLDDLNVLVGVTCTPISVVGVGGDSCTAQPVCCDNNNFNGVIAIGCIPVNLNL